MGWKCICSNFDDQIINEVFKEKSQKDIWFQPLKCKTESCFPYTSLTFNWIVWILDCWSGKIFENDNLGMLNVYFYYSLTLWTKLFHLLVEKISGDIIKIQIFNSCVQTDNQPLTSEHKSKLLFSHFLTELDHILQFTQLLYTLPLLTRTQTSLSKNNYKMSV